MYFQLEKLLLNISNPISFSRALLRFIIFGSFITANENPQDIDIFLLMDDTFDVGQVTGEAGILFNHIAAQNYEGASIFWLRRMSALEGEERTINHWQLKRDGNIRGIVEVLIND